MTPQEPWRYLQKNVGPLGFEGNSDPWELVAPGGLLLSGVLVGLVQWYKGTKDRQPSCSGCLARTQGVQSTPHRFLAGVPPSVLVSSQLQWVESGGVERKTGPVDESNTIINRWYDRRLPLRPVQRLGRLDSGQERRLDWSLEWSYDQSTATAPPTSVTVLPDYRPDPSFLPTATRPLSGDELMRRYSISKSQFHNRKNALPNIRGVVQGRSKVFTLSEIHQLDACHWYLNNGYSLKQVEDAQRNFTIVGVADEGVFDVDGFDQEVEAVEPQTNLSKVPSASVAQFTNTMERVATTLETIQGSQTLLKDPLRTLRSLQEASDAGWEVSSKVLSNILEIAPATVHGWKTDQHRHGFHLKKIGPGKWKVIREDEGSDQGNLTGKENA